MTGLQSPDGLPQLRAAALGKDWRRPPLIPAAMLTDAARAELVAVFQAKSAEWEKRKTKGNANGLPQIDRVLELKLIKVRHKLSQRQIALAYKRYLDPPQRVKLAPVSGFVESTLKQLGDRSLIVKRAVEFCRTSSHAAMLMGDPTPARFDKLASALGDELEERVRAMVDVMATHRAKSTTAIGNVRSAFHSELRETRQAFIQEHAARAEEAIRSLSAVNARPMLHVALLDELDEALFAATCEKLAAHPPVQVPPTCSPDVKDLRAQLLYYLTGWLMRKVQAAACHGTKALLEAGPFWLAWLKANGLASSDVVSLWDLPSVRTLRRNVHDSALYLPRKELFMLVWRMEEHVVAVLTRDHIALVRGDIMLEASKLILASAECAALFAATLPDPKPAEAEQLALFEFLVDKYMRVRGPNFARTALDHMFTSLTVESQRANLRTKLATVAAKSPGAQLSVPAPEAMLTHRESLAKAIALGDVDEADGEGQSAEEVKADERMVDSFFADIESEQQRCLLDDEVNDGADVEHLNLITKGVQACFGNAASAGGSADPFAVSGDHADDE